MTRLELKGTHWSKLFTVVRFLLGKVVYEGHGTLSQEEEFLLLEAYTLLDLCANYDFVIHKRGQLIKLSTLINYYNLCRLQTFEGAQVVFVNKAKILQRLGVLPTAHAYFGWANLFNVSRFVRRVNPERPRRVKRQKRFLGVGYRDKGTMKNMATDSSPSWQEVANARIEPPTSEERDLVTYNLYWTNWGYHPENIPIESDVPTRPNALGATFQETEKKQSNGFVLHDHSEQKLLK